MRAGGYSRNVTTKVSVAVIINAPRESVFGYIGNIEGQTAWMTDAKKITMLSSQVQGIGVRFRVDTRVGPLRTQDEMEVTDWASGRLIKIAHGGLIKGEGVFSTVDYGMSKTLFSWEEELIFPTFLGGRLAEALARPILTRIFQRDLDNLKRIIEATPS